jgi:mandelate racemase
MVGEKLTLKSVALTAVAVPLKRPIAVKIAEIKEWPFILVDLYTHEGVVGRAYLEPYLAHAAGAIMAVMRHLAEAAAGKSLAPREQFLANRRALNFVGLSGASMIAAAGLDMAMWDALAKAANLPLAVLLGGSRAPVPAYNSNGLWLADPGTLAKEAGELAAEGGFTGLKLRLGRERLADDLAAIRAVREGVGADVKLMTDFNQCLTLGDALHRCHALDDQGLYWFEEPIVYDNLPGYAQLTRELKTPVQLGENFYGPRDLHAAIAAGAGDYVMPDLMRIGGVSGWLAAAPIAAAAGVQISTHLYPEFSAHLLRVSESAHWLEWQDWSYPLLREPFVVKDGLLYIPDRPGAGIEWDAAAVKRYRYEA